MIDYSIIFITGLTTGGLTCLALQGGLLTAALVQPGSRRDGPPPPPPPLSVVYFLLAKLAAHTLLGFCLGWVGAALRLTPEVQGALQIVVGGYMLVTALNLLNVHPIFRYAVLQPPRAWTRLVRQQSKQQSAFTPLLLGALTVLIPCGTTQAMMTVAIASGNAVSGALVLAVFVLGTSPTFFVLGFLATQLRGRLQQVFGAAAALLILVLGGLSINSGLVLVGSPLAPQTVLARLFPGEQVPVPAQMAGSVQEIVINVHDESYEPNLFLARPGVPLRLRLLTNDLWGCTAIFIIPGQGVREFLPTTGETIIDLPAQPPGMVPFSCGMGMYSGTILVQAAA
ncbi:MAG: sulfite exporter TauE/SafE family protein [Anaerolineae bacterium]|nr:sulfite exporter TauE/SafE family protein [Anaerolineae bacterium]